VDGDGDNKNALRGRLRAARAALSPAERARADANVRERLLGMGEWERADVVYAYLSFGDEVDSRSLVDAALRAGKHVALPRCIEKSPGLSWHYVRSFDGLVPGPFGILEPDPAACEAAPSRGSVSSIALVPGLTFDDDGFRLGYGGGYYDRFLSGFLGSSIGLCRSDLRVSSLAVLGCIEDHDVPVDLVVEG
jgi:5-formyltetrahydrofolate cyclo-ligase